jgi:hypothetical protein
MSNSVRSLEGEINRSSPRAGDDAMNGKDYSLLLDEQP